MQKLISIRYLPSLSGSGIIYLQPNLYFFSCRDPDKEKIMEKKSTWLIDYKSNVNSQGGEDGIIEKILEIIPDNSGWCVEFGAWDGIFLSNIRNLIQSKGYSAVFIEGSKSRFDILCKNYEPNPNVVCVNKFVGFESNNNLDQILTETQIPKDFDLLSIDIDGNDYHVWKSVSEYKPKAICIEFNPTIPTEIKFVQPADTSINQGCSLLSIVELSREKGYELVAVLSLNAFFVRKEYFPLFGIKDNNPEVLRTDLSLITHIFVGYDGKIFLRGSKKLLWHGMEIKEKRIQHLPSVIQRLPGNYGKLRLLVYWSYLLFRDPSVILKKISSKFFK